MLSLKDYNLINLHLTNHYILDHIKILDHLVLLIISDCSRNSLHVTMCVFMIRIGYHWDLDFPSIIDY